MEASTADWALLLDLLRIRGGWCGPGQFGQGCRRGAGTGRIQRAILRRTRRRVGARGVSTPRFGLRGAASAGIARATTGEPHKQNEGKCEPASGAHHEGDPGSRGLGVGVGGGVTSGDGRSSGQPFSGPGASRRASGGGVGGPPCGASGGGVGGPPPPPGPSAPHPENRAIASMVPTAYLRFIVLTSGPS